MSASVWFEQGNLVLVRSRTSILLTHEVNGATAATEQAIAFATANDLPGLLQVLRSRFGDGSFADVAAIMAWGQAHYHVAVAGSLWVSLQDLAGSMRIEPSAGNLYEATAPLAAVAAIQTQGALPLHTDAGTDMDRGAVRAGRVLLHAGALEVGSSAPTGPVPATMATPALIMEPESQAQPEPSAPTPAPAPRPAPPAFGAKPNEQLLDLSQPPQQRAPLPTESEVPSPPLASQAVMVQGVSCPADHHNHPEAQYCANCGRRMGVNMTLQFSEGPRPPLGLLIADDGLSFSLISDVIIGREPESHPDVVGDRALAWRLPDESSELSRSHLRIVLQDWNVLVIDLGSSNGTSVRRRDSQTLEQIGSEHPMHLGAGDSIRIGRRELRLELHHVQT